MIGDAIWQLSAGDSGNQRPTAIRQLSSGDLSVTGYEELYYPYRRFTWLAQVSPSGNLISMVNIDSSGLHGLTLVDMAILESDNIVLCGIRSDSLWLGVFDTAGNPGWTKTYLAGISVAAISICDSNNILVTGSSHDSLFLARVSAEGTLRWARVYSRAGHDIVGGTSVLQLGDGRIVVGTNIGDWAGDYVDTKAGVYFLTSSGDFQSLHFYGNHYSNTETVQRMALDSSGNIILLGHILLGYIGYDDASLRLINSEGSELWYHHYGSWNLDVVSDMTLDPAGNIYVSGYTRGFGIPNNRDYWVFKCSSEGSLIWNFWTGSMREENAISVTLSGGDVFFVGTSDTMFGHTRSLVYRVHETPTNVDDHRIPLSNDVFLNMYPNPFNSSSVVEFGIPGPSYTRLAVYDLLGRQVAVLVDNKFVFGNHREVFDGSHLSSGTYVLRLQTDRAILTKKVMILK